MNTNKIVISIIILMMISVGFLSGCISEEKITVVIDSHYDWYASGDIIFDTGDTFGAVGAHNNDFTYEIQKKELSLQKNTYNITLVMEGAGERVEKTAYNVKSYVKFGVWGGDNLMRISVEMIK